MFSDETECRSDGALPFPCRQQMLASVLFWGICALCISCADPVHEDSAVDNTLSGSEPMVASNPEDACRLWIKGLRNNNITLVEHTCSEDVRDILNGYHAQDLSLASVLPFQEIEGIQCVIEGDSGICYIAALADDMLVLDSLYIRRQDTLWQVYKCPFIGNVMVQ